MIRGVAVVAALVCGAAHACGDVSATIATGAHYTIAYTTVPAPIAIGEHFAIEFSVCPRDKAPAAQAVRVDASMPEHRHGMNYRPTIVATAPGQYRAEGLLFHMSGRWEIAFDIVARNTTERVTSTVVLD